VQAHAAQRRDAGAKVQMRIEGGTETVDEGHRAEARRAPGALAVRAQARLYRAQEQTCASGMPTRGSRDMASWRNRRTNGLSSSGWTTRSRRPRSCASDRGRPTSAIAIQTNWTFDAST
jgi:hypothetical protein